MTKSRRHARYAIPALLLVLAPGFFAATPAGAAPLAARIAAAASPRCRHRTAAAGTITVADSFFVGPNLSPTNPSAAFVPQEALFDQLFRYDSRGRLYAMMAEVVPTLRNRGVRDGGRTIVLHLKHGLLWSNGTEITSGDIKFGWRMGMDPASGPYCGGTCDVIGSIDTPDRYTAVLHLQRVDPALLSPDVLFNGSMPIVWPAHWSGWNNDPHAAVMKLFADPAYTFSGPNYPTNGPYQVMRVNATRAVLRPMKYYDDMNCGASVRTLIFETYNTGNSPSSAAQVAAAAAGKIDVGLDYFPGDIPSLLRHRGTYSVHFEPLFGFEHLEFNLDRTYLGKPNPVANTKVRLALALALNKLAVVRTALPLDVAHAKQIEAWTPWVHTSRLAQPYADPEVTGQWDPLAKAGKGAYTDSTGGGFTLDLYTTQKPERIAMMPAIARQWAKLGIRVTQHSISSQDFFGSWEAGGVLDHGAFEAALFAENGGPNPDPLALLMESRYVDRDQANHNFQQDQNIAGIRDRTLDRALVQATGTFNQSIRKRDFFTVQKRLNQQAYWIPLYYNPAISTSNHRIASFQSNPASFEGWNIYNWKVRGR